MFETMIVILVYSFWMTLILGTILNIASRVLIILKGTYKTNIKWLILCTPFSYGVLKYADESIYKRIHRIIMIVFFITAFLASLLLFYIKFEIGVY